MTIEDKNMGSIEEKNGNKVVLMDFFAEWCGPCKMQDPIIEKLKQKFGDKVEFKKINVDAEGTYNLVEKYSISAIPTIVIEKGGKFFAKYVGMTSQHVIEKKINEIIE